MNKFTVYSLQFTVLIVLSAILLSSAFSSFNLEFLTWFAFVPLFFALEGENRLKAVYPRIDELAWGFLIAYFCGFLFFIFSMYWLIYVTVAGWIALSLYQALYFGIFGLTFAYFLRTTNYELRTTNYLTLPSLWALLEYIRSHLAGGIGWNLLGYSQYKNLPLIQIADITGVWGVSFLIVLMNVAIYSVIKMAIKCYGKDPKFKIRGNASFKEELRINPVIQIFFVLALFIGVLAYGYLVIASEVHETDKAKPLASVRDFALRKRETKQYYMKISVVQGDIPQRVKWDAEFKDEIMNRYEDLTKQALKDRPQLIIWPETAVPGYLNYEKELMQWISRLVKKAKIPLLAGTPMISESDSGKNYNSAVLFSNRGIIAGRYDKLHLVAFGEFVPFEKQFPFLRKLLPITGNFIPGSGYTVFKLTTYNLQPTTNFSVLICFEDIFPGLVREFVKRGADFMVNITNDAWFGKTCAAYQHTACSVFRAVENRRPFIRSTNTGLSCFIDKTGKIYDKVSKDNSDLFIHGVKTASIKIDRDKTLTFYAKYCDLFILGCVIVFIINAAISVKK